MSHAHDTQKETSGNKPKSGKVIGYVIIAVFVLVALFTIADFVNGGVKEKKEDQGYFPKNPDNENRKGSEKSSGENQNVSTVTISGDEPAENNLSIPPGSTYEIRVSVPVYILFEDANGNTETRELRPGQRAEFPVATPIKVWRQKPGESRISYSFTLNS